jgi:hypothetical protein
MTLAGSDASTSPSASTSSPFSRASAPRLESVYGDGTWVKMEWTHRIPSGSVIQATAGGSTVVPPPQNVTIHFFKNIDTGEVVEFKFK